MKRNSPASEPVNNSTAAVGWRFFHKLPAILLALVLAGAPASGFAQDPVESTAPPVATAIAGQPAANATVTEAHPVRDSGIGCATGAVLGSVLPGLGNAVGCVVGGFLGWWLSKTPAAP